MKPSAPLTIMAPAGGDVRTHGGVVALDVVLEAEEDDELVVVGGAVVEDVVEVVLGGTDELVEVEDGAADDVDMLAEEVVEVTETGLEVVEVAIFKQEHPLEIFEGNAEHAVAHVGRVIESVAVVYVEQNGAASEDEASIALYFL